MAKTNVKIKLTGTDGNAFSILGKVRNALRKEGHVNLIEQYMKEATAGDYDNLLRVSMEYVEIN